MTADTFPSIYYVVHRIEGGGSPAEYLLSADGKWTYASKAAKRFPHELAARAALDKLTPALARSPFRYSFGISRKIEKGGDDAAQA